MGGSVSVEPGLSVTVAGLPALVRDGAARMSHGVGAPAVALLDPDDDWPWTEPEDLAFPDKGSAEWYSEMAGATRGRATRKIPQGGGRTRDGCGGGGFVPKCAPLDAMRRRRGMASANAALIAAQAAHAAHGLADRAALWAEHPRRAELLGIKEELMALLVASGEIAARSVEAAAYTNAGATADRDAGKAAAAAEAAAAANALEKRVGALRDWLTTQARAAVMAGRALREAQALDSKNPAQLDIACTLLDECQPGWGDPVYAARLEMEDKELGDVGGMKWAAGFDAKIQRHLKQKAVAVRVGAFDEAAASHEALLSLGHASDPELEARQKLAEKLSAGMAELRSFVLEVDMRSAERATPPEPARLDAARAKVEQSKVVERHLESISIKLRGLLKHRAGDTTI